MNDVDIRTLMFKQFPAGSVLLDELALGNKVGSMTRADLVHVHPEGMHSYEIKGDNDSLKRVPLQLKCYSHTFSKVSFVVTTKHLVGLSKLVPTYVGVIEVTSDGQLVELRPATPSPLHDKKWVTYLLWKSELFALIRANHMVPRGTKLYGWEMRNMLQASELFTPEHLELYAVQCLMNRLDMKLERKSSVRSRENFRKATS